MSDYETDEKSAGAFDGGYDDICMSYEEDDDSSQEAK
jgi:hypothetical protein